MAFGIKYSSGGDYLPVVTYDAKAGRLFKVDKTPTTDGWRRDKVDITTEFKAVMDLEFVEVGWIHFANGIPDFHMAAATAALFPERPSKDHRQGFRMRVFAPKLLGGAREFSHASKLVVNAVDELHTTYLDAPEAKRGLLPVVRLAAVTPIEMQIPGGRASFYEPRFEITQWVERPDALPRMTPSEARDAVEKRNGANGHGAVETDDFAAADNKPPASVPAAVADLDDEIPF